MFRSIKKSESHISVNLEEPLTGHACSQLIIEIIKYIMYQKQQIPISCDSLIKLHANSKPTDRNFSLMQNVINSWCTVTNQLSSQFSLEECDIREIIIVIGATIVSPKLCIRLELPSNILSSHTHLDHQHSYRKPLLNVMRSIIECPEFQDEMTVPLGPTNTFLLLQKKDPRKISEFFIPKPQFCISSPNTSCFHIKLNNSESNGLQCRCENMFRVHHDSSNGHYIQDQCIVETTNNYETEVLYQWYQSKEVFKGFKFVK